MDDIRSLEGELQGLKKDILSLGGQRIRNTLDIKDNL